MRILSYIIIAAGIILLALAGYDEMRGSTHAPSMGSLSGIGGATSSGEIITRAGDPQDFHNAMTYHWFFASMLVGAGIIVALINKRQDAVDPMSADSDEKIDEELREDEQSEQTKNEGTKWRQSHIKEPNVNIVTDTLSIRPTLRGSLFSVHTASR